MTSRARSENLFSGHSLKEREPIPTGGLQAVLRIVTNPKIPRPATPMQTALTFCRRLVEWPRAVFVMPSRTHWDLFVKMCDAIEGPLVTDA